MKIDPTNAEVFHSSCGSNSDDVRLFTTGTLDQVINWPTEQTSPVRFVIGCTGNKGGSSKNKKYRIIGHANGLLRFLQMDKLDIFMQHQIPLDDDEEITAGAFSFGDNFAVGTSYGNVFFGNMKNEDRALSGRSYVGCQIAQLKGLANDTCHAVTAIQMGQFTPEGCVIVAFDDGNVRTWQSCIQQDGGQ